MSKYGLVTFSVASMLLLMIGCGSSTQRQSVDSQSEVTESSSKKAAKNENSIRSKGLHTSINDPGKRVSLEKHLEPDVKTVFEFYGDW